MSKAELPEHVVRLIERRKETRWVESMANKSESVLNKKAQSIYDKTKEHLKGMGIWRDEDHSLLQTFAYNKGKWEEVSMQLEDKFFVDGARGRETVKHPGWELQSQFMKAYLQAGDKLGIGALVRNKMKWEATEEVVDDPTDPMKLE